MRFFDDQTITEEREPDTETVQASLVPREAPPADIERAFVSSAVRLKLPENNGRRAQEKVEALAWQSAAWSAYDRIGEVKFAAGMIGQVVSRMRLYAGVVDDPRRAPVTADDYVKQLADDVVAEDTRAAMTFADEIVHDLRINSQAGSLGAMLRMAAINIWIAGEMFLIRDKGKWRVASVKELTRSGNGRGAGYSLRKGRESRSGTMDLDPQSFIARIWRQHPAISGEPDSSMLGVLDESEELILLMQVIRVITRSRMNAGALFVPDGVGTVDLEELLYNAANSPINDESAVSTIVPLLLQGPAELGKEIKLIDLSRRVDQELIDLTRRTTDRMLSGLDLPKELVSGLSGVKFANSIAITDEFFSAHVEPLVTMLCDAFTSVVMRPALRARGVSEDLLNRVVVWYDPSAIVTRPDKSAAANDGYDRKILSGESWRASRGFTELDAPDQDELIQRLAIEKAAIAPEMATTLIESLHPEFFAALREGNQEAAGMPEDISDILSGELPPGAPMPATPGEFDATQPETPGVPGPETPTPPGRPEESTDFQGGEITAPNGKQPPRRSAPR